jgi:hypothetical protein
LSLSGFRLNGLANEGNRRKVEVEDDEAIVGAGEEVGPGTGVEEVEALGRCLPKGGRVSLGTDPA